MEQTFMKHVFITDSDFANTDSSFQYLLGFQPSLGAMILDENELIILLDGRYFSKTKDVSLEHIKDILNKQDMRVRFVNITKLTESLISELQADDEIILEDNIAVKYLNSFQDAFPENKLLFSRGYFTEMKIIKNTLEKENIKKAISIIDNVFLYIQSIADSGEIIGKTELQVRQLIIAKIFEFGGKGESFESIVAFGKNSVIPHHVSGATIIENGVLLIDMGAKYNSYCSDFTRTIWVGKENEQFQKFQEAYEIVKLAHMSPINKYTPGMTGEDLDIISRNIVQNSQYKDLFIHNLGHGLGLDIHEEPRLKSGDTTLLQDNMIFTIEPGIYIDGEFGIRLEDIVFLENKKLIKYTQINL